MVSPLHPRPQLQRPIWESLDGHWDFALEPDVRWTWPDEVVWQRSINVPFAPETPLSGVGAEGFSAPAGIDGQSRSAQHQTGSGYSSTLAP
jgi:hypothetical protein